MVSPILQLGSRITIAPIVHGSGDFAWEVRRLLLSESFDCLAVPLPASFQSGVERAILDLPRPSAVVQRSAPEFAVDDQPQASYVPIDPCQGVIAAIRSAMEEHIPRRFIDLETSRFVPVGLPFPDPFALKKVSLEQYAAAVVPFLRQPPHAQWQMRINHMAAQLRALAGAFERILFVCGILEWPWIRQDYLQEAPPAAEHDLVDDPDVYPLEARSAYFMLGEIPFITGLYERARQELGDDTRLSIDGVKQLLLEARDSYRTEYRARARRITHKLLATCLKYARNLTLMDRHFSPQLTTIVTAAQQTLGDGYALHVLETAKSYPYRSAGVARRIKFGIGRATLPDGDTLQMVSRLAGPPLVWRSLQLIPRPDRRQTERWKQRWNPNSQCSWPPEDQRIENFRAAVFDRARQIMGQDLARTEKFTTSVKDGIDIRDTLRHWHQREIYVKVLPPNRGKLDAVVMLFDSPTDPRDYRWRATWYAEHAEESTLAFFATDFQQTPIGPGICLANYGGAMFLFPPRPIIDIWMDRGLDFAETLEERLIAAACAHSEASHVALLSPLPPGAAWKQIARAYSRKLVHVPLGQFSDETVQRLRMVHVLNGRQVRSYAAEFIRKA